MFGLKKCKEEDFYQFTYSNGKYYPENFDGFLLGILIGIFAFGGIEYCYLSVIDIPNKSILDIGCIAFVVINVLIIKMIRIKNKKYSYRFQKPLVLLLSLYWFIFSFSIYPAPLILGIAEHHVALVQSVICAIAIGLIYFVVIFIRLIHLIRHGQMRKECEGLYEQLISSKIAVGASVSIPFIVISGKLARNVTNVMDSSGNRVGPLIIMLILGFIINIIICTLIPECIILAYCKFRFESFNIASDPKVRERMYKLEERRKRRERNNMQMIKKDDNNNQKKRKKHKKRNKQ